MAGPRGADQWRQRESDTAAAISFSSSPPKEDHPPVFRVADYPGYGAGGVPWRMIAPHERQAMRNHGQSLRQLHEHGGLVWCEALAVLEDREWRADKQARDKVLARLAAWQEQGQ